MLGDIPQAAKNEEAKLTASFVNAIAIAAVVAGILGPYITSIPDSDLTAQTRLRLVLIGFCLHLAARLVLRYIKVG
jgi:hypothetical protein